MADYYSQRALAVKSQTESSLRANSQRQQLEPSQQASSTMGGGSVQQVFHPILARLHSIQHQQVPPGTIMVEGAPVFLTCQDQELLEVAKAVLREKFPQVKILGVGAFLCFCKYLIAFRWRRSAAAKQVGEILGFATPPGLFLIQLFCILLVLDYNNN